MRWAYTGVILALLGITNLIAPFNLASLFDKPDLYADYEIYKESNSVDVEIGNKGGAPATGLSLIFYSSIKFSNFTNLIYSTNDVFLEGSGLPLSQNETKVVNSFFLKLNAPRLAQGDGSYINLQFFFQEPVDTTKKFFNLDVVSDQGRVYAMDRDHRPLFLKGIVFYQQLSGLVQIWVMFFVIWFLLIFYDYRRARKLMGMSSTARSVN